MGITFSINRFAVCCLLILLPMSPTFKAAEVTPQVHVAFPGAEGFGAQSIGGRGGKVIWVTNLNDGGEGSLRAAIEAEGRRTVVFRVGGTIELKSELVLSKPYITIAGQTAPGGGITLKNHPSNPRSSLTIKDGAHDVIIRHLRIRPGPPTTREQPGDDSHIQDALQILDASRIIIDHCSFSWATDEVVSTFSSASDISIQWCIIAEALLNTRRGGPDGKGLLIGGPKAQRISVHHNILAHNIGRNPLTKVPGQVDIVNNIVLAPATTAMAFDGENGRTQLNLIGNVVLAPNGDGLVYGARIVGSNPVSLFIEDNIGPFRQREDQPSELFLNPSNEGRTYITRGRFIAPPVTIFKASEAQARVLNQAGCTCPARDAVDIRILKDVLEQHCRLIEDPSEVGGWPDIAEGIAYEDSDMDGMADEWERLNGLNPADAADAAMDANNDGYTNLEEFLNGIASPQ